MNLSIATVVYGKYMCLFSANLKLYIQVQFQMDIQNKTRIHMFHVTTTLNVSGSLTILVIFSV